MNVLVDDGASGPYFDDALILGLWHKLGNHQVFDALHKITIAGGHQLAEVERGLLRSNAVDDDGAQVQPNPLT